MFFQKTGSFFEIIQIFLEKFFPKKGILEKFREKSESTQKMPIAIVA